MRVIYSARARLPSKKEIYCHIDIWFSSLGLHVTTLYCFSKLILRRAIEMISNILKCVDIFLQLARILHSRPPVSSPISSLSVLSPSVCKVNILNMITNTHKNYELSLRRLIWFVLKILKVFSCFSILALILDIKVRMIQLRWMDSEGQKEGILFWSSFSHFTNMSIHSHSSWEFALLVFIWIYIDLSLI